MKKVFIISALLVACANISNAQNEVKYLGEVNLGYSIGIGAFDYNRVNLHTVQSAKVGDYVSIGLGIGLDWWRGIYKEYWDRKDMFDSGELSLPIYFNTKGYLPVNNKLTPYISCDLGYAVGLTVGVKKYGGFYFSPAVGLKFNSFKTELGFSLQKITNKSFEYEYDTDAATAFKLLVGYIF